MTYYQKLKEFLKIYKAPLFSGVLFGCSFIPFPFFAWFFCLVPLWLFLYQQNSLKKVVIACFLCQSVATLIGFNWIFYTFHTFAEMNFLLSLLSLLLFCVFANCYICISGLLWFVLSKKTSVSSVKLLLLPILFSVFHFIIPTLFPWNMGYPWLWSGFFGAQTAEIWGMRFLNTLFYMFNLLFLIVFYHLKKTKSTQTETSSRFKRYFNSFKLDSIGLKTLLGAVFLFVFINLFGFYLKQRLAIPDKILKIVMVQHNVNTTQLYQKGFKPYSSPEEKAFVELKTLTYRSLQKIFKEKKSWEDIDFIVWPEGAYPYPIRKSAKTDKKLNKLTRVVNIPLITGGISINPNQTIANSVFVFNRKGFLLKPIYDKMKLIILGEYIPLIDRFKFLKKVFPYFGMNMLPGNSLIVQELEGVKYGFPICFEALFDTLTRELANKKAQILINVSNDSWYGNLTQQPYQHLVMSFSRAIEVRRPLIRSTNTGFSGVILADGTVQQLSPFKKPWSGIYKIPYYENPPKTLFMGWGYFINEIFLSLLALFMLALHFRRST